MRVMIASLASTSAFWLMTMVPRNGVDKLRELGDQGNPQALVEATGRVYGAYLLTSLSETRRELFNDGTPRLIDFQMQLERDDDGASEAIA